MIDKKQLIGGAIGLIAILGYSVYSGKLDISQFTGGGSDAEVTFERRLPPPVEQHTDVAPGDVKDVPADDVLASVSGVGSTDDYVDELTGEVAPSVEMPADLAVEMPSDSADLTAAVAQPITLAPSAAVKTVAPVAQLASNDPSKLMVGGTAFTATQVFKPGAVPAAGAGPSVPNAAPGLPGQVGPLPAGGPVAGLPASPNGVAPVNPNAAAALVPSAGLLAPGQGSASVPGTAVIAKVNGAGEAAKVPAVTLPAQFVPSAGVPSAGLLAATPVFDAGSALSTGAVASLPTNATGQDLLLLQTQLAVLDKQKAIASGQEAIAESLLKTRKAQYEMTQIGRPTAEQQLAIAQAQAQAQAQVQATQPPAPPPSPLFGIKLLSTARANGGTSATISYNGKLVDVKKGSVVAGFLVDKVSDNSVVFIGEGETKTVWID